MSCQIALSSKVVTYLYFQLYGRRTSVPLPLITLDNSMSNLYIKLDYIVIIYVDSRILHLLLTNILLLLNYSITEYTFFVILLIDHLYSFVFNLDVFLNSEQLSSLTYL